LDALTAKVIGSTPSRIARDAPSRRSDTSGRPCSEAPATRAARLASAVAASTSMRAGVHHFEEHVARLDDLPNDEVGAGDHAADRRGQGLARGQAGADAALALGQALRLGAGRIDLLARHGAFQAFEALHALLGELALRPQLGQLGLLRAQGVGLGVVAHIGQHVAALHRLPGDRQPFGPGSMRPPCTACTRPLAFGSMTTRPGSSTVAAASDSGASTVRMAMRRCAILGTLTLPSGSRARPEALTGAPGASRCSPLGPWAPEALGRHLGARAGIDAGTGRRRIQVFAIRAVGAGAGAERQRQGQQQGEQQRAQQGEGGRLHGSSPSDWLTRAWARPSAAWD
jgi:hypothetical protein